MAFENLLKRRGRNTARRGPDPTFEHSNIIGVNYADSIFAMAPNQSPYGLNADFGNPVGSVAKRDGFESLITSLGTGKMTGLHGWQHSVGDQMIAAWDKNLYLLTGNSGSVSKSSQADWQAGTLTDVEATSSPGDIKLYAGTFSEVDTLDADFDGTHSNTQATSDSVQLLSSTNLTGITNLAACSDWVPGATPIEMGWKFTATSRKVNRLGIYSPVAESKTIRLWKCSDGSKLAEVTVDATADAWVWGDITEITLAAGDYIVSLGVPGYAHIYYNAKASDTFGSGITALGLISNSTIATYPNSALDTANIAGIVDIGYTATGTYTHGEQDPSSEDASVGITIVFNKTTPAGTTLTVESRISTDSGSTWGAWEERTSGDIIIPVGTDKTGYRIQWRANLISTVSGTSPSLDDVTVAATYSGTGNWISPVYDLTNTPISNILTFTVTEPADTSAIAYARGSSNGTVFGDWQEVLNSGDSIPLQRYMQIKFVLATTDIAATSTVSSFLISYSSSYTTANKLDIGPLGRVSDLLTGNRVCMESYEDWLLCADGLRPWLLYITTATQEADTAQAGGASTITLKAGASAVNSFYNNAFVTITGGTGEGQVRWISGYVGATKVATVSVAWTTQPDDTSTYSIGSAVKARNLGVNPPTVAPSGVANADAGSPNGAYLLKVTYVNDDGVESNPGDASATVTVTSKKIDWTIPVDASAGNTTAKRRLYRTAAGGSVYKYLAEVADNTTTTYTDNIADVALGSLMLDNNNIPPTVCTLLYTFTSYVFYVDGYDMWYSKAGAPDQVPNIAGDIQVNVFTGRIADIKSHPTALIVTGENFIATITSNTGFIFDSDPTIDTTTTKIIDNNGGLSFEASAMCLSPNLRSTLVINTNTGLRATVPGLQDNSIESVPLSRNIQPYFERSINRDQAAGVFFNNYYLYSMEHQPADGSASERLTFAYDLRTEQWYGPWTFGMSCYTVSKNVLYAGDAENGKIYRMFSGSSDAGANIEMVVDLPMRAPAGEAGTCKFKQVLPIISADSDTTATVIKPKVDDREVSISLGALTSAFTGDVRPGHDFIRPKKYRVPLPSGHTYSVRIEDDSVNPLVVEKVVTEYEVLMVNR